MELALTDGAGNNLNELIIGDVFDESFVPKPLNVGLTSKVSLSHVSADGVASISRPAARRQLKMLQALLQLASADLEKHPVCQEIAKDEMYLAEIGEFGGLCRVVVDSEPQPTTVVVVDVVDHGVTRRLHVAAIRELNSPVLAVLAHLTDRVKLANAGPKFTGRDARRIMAIAPPEIIVKVLDVQGPYPLVELHARLPYSGEFISINSTGQMESRQEPVR